MPVEDEETANARRLLNYPQKNKQPKNNAYMVPGALDKMWWANESNNDVASRMLSLRIGSRCIRMLSLRPFTRIVTIGAVSQRASYSRLSDPCTLIQACTSTGSKASPEDTFFRL